MKDKLKTAVDWLRRKGVTYADCRYVRRENESIQVTDRTVDSVSRNLDVGVGIRVLVNGSWGFAATSQLTSADLQKTAGLALQIAKASAVIAHAPAVLAEQDIYVDHYRSLCEIDPFALSPDQKTGLLLQVTEILKKAKAVKTAEASMEFYKTHKIFVSTEGAEIEQEITESGAGYRAVAFDGKEAQTRSYPNSHRGGVATLGYEYIESLRLLDHAERVREEAVALLKATPCPDMQTTVIICAPQMALQVHESCGHPIELDRVLGTEISLAGGSFLTLDKLGKFQYGSDIVNITADATTIWRAGHFRIRRRRSQGATDTDRGAGSICGLSDQPRDGAGDCTAIQWRDARGRLQPPADYPNDQHQSGARQLASGRVDQRHQARSLSRLEQKLVH